MILTHPPTLTGKDLFGTSNSESLAGLLLTLTACLLAFLESPVCVLPLPLPLAQSSELHEVQADGRGAEGSDSTSRALLAQLQHHLLNIADRQVVPEYYTSIQQPPLPLQPLLCILYHYLLISTFFSNSTPS